MARTKTPAPARCPMCGFQYDWAGRRCGHCGFPATGRRNWHAAKSISTVWTAAAPAPLRRAVQFAAGCFRRVWPLLPDDGARRFIDRLGRNPADALTPPDPPAAEFLMGLRNEPLAPRLAPPWSVRGALRVAAELAQVSAPTLELVVPLARHLQWAAVDADTPPRDWISFPLPEPLERHRAELAAMPFGERHRIERDRNPSGLFRAYSALGAASAAHEKARHDRRAGEEAAQCVAFRCAFPYPFDPIPFDPAWRTRDALALAARMDDTGDFAPAPILADALQDAGCDNPDVLDHCRDPHTAHARGCWAADLVLGRV